MLLLFNIQQILFYNMQDREYQKNQRIKERSKSKQKVRNQKQIQKKYKKQKKQYYRKRSYSRSSQSERRQRISKKQKHKHHKQKRQRQRSSSSSNSKHQAKNNKRNDYSRSRQKYVQNKIQNKNLSRPRIKINSSFLSSLIIDQKFNNRKLDEEDISNTTKKLQKNFNESRNSVTMSQYLSNQALRINPITKLQEKKYRCQLQKCGKQLNSIEDYQKHLQKHREQL